MQYQFSDLIVTSAEPLPELQVAGEGAAEVAINWMAAGPTEHQPVFAAWPTPSGGQWLTFADAADGFLLTFTGLGQFDVSRDAARVTVRPFPGVDRSTMRHLLLNQVLPLVLSRRGRLVLHASAISRNGRVAAFIGRSGAGKSTMAAACAAGGAAVVTDDCLVLRREGARWLAVPCDAGVRLWPDTLELLGWPRASGAGMAHFTDKRRVGAAHPAVRFETAALPLACLIRLSRPDEPHVTGVLRGRHAVIALASELFRLDVRDARESRWQFDAISALATDVSIEAPVRAHPIEAAAAVLCRM